MDKEPIQQLHPATEPGGSDAAFNTLPGPRVMLVGRTVGQLVSQAAVNAAREGFEPGQRFDPTTGETIIYREARF